MKRISSFRNNFEIKLILLKAWSPLNLRTVSMFIRRKKAKISIQICWKKTNRIDYWFVCYFCQCFVLSVTKGLFAFALRISQLQNLVNFFTIPFAPFLSLELAQADSQKILPDQSYSAYTPLESMYGTLKFVLFHGSLYPQSVCNLCKNLKK